jgi:gelsolin
MSGLVKPKKYDWKDSNLAMFGSDTEKQVKKESADQEPAWKGVGQAVGLQIWRIVNFKVTDWPKSQYGQFYNGDSYIILHTYKQDPASNDLDYDLHFWIGSNSSQDEYGTAAYKTVELDTYLDDKPVQHREVEGHESDLFLSYFPKGVMLMEGGAESGFHHVEPTKYATRLLHFSGQGKKIVVAQVPAAKSSLNSGDVYILDMGLTIYQWNGSGASVFEKNKAVEFLNNMKADRPGKAITVEVLDEGSSGFDSSHPFYAALTETDSSGDSYHVKKPGPGEDVTQLLRVSDAAGSVTCTPIKSGGIFRKDLDSQDVFIVDTVKNCFVWVGSGASPAEKRNGLGYAHSHLMSTYNPLRPIVVVKEGHENKEFKLAIAA